MKAISLWQPWASLIAVGAKRIETRHWEPPARLLGERIAIHAAKRETELWRLTLDAFDAALLDEPRPLPLGAIVCTVRLVSAYRVSGPASAPSAEERSFGNWGVGRYAWGLADLERLAVPVPTVGRQGFFDVPDLGLGRVVAT